MRSSRALGQALAAAFACAADDPPPPAGDSHGLVPEAVVAGWFVRPAQNSDRTVIGDVLVLNARHARAQGKLLLKDRAPHPGTGRVAGRGALPLIRFAPDAADLDRVRAVAKAVNRDQHQRRPSTYGNTPPAERGPPATTD